MKILAPVKNLLVGVELIDAGAEEVYFGIVSGDWNGKRGYSTILNRRDGALANFSNYEDARKFMDYAHSQNVEAFLTLNNTPLVDNEKEILVEIERALSVGPDAVIVKDPLIAKLVRTVSSDAKIHCSSLNQVFNRDAVSYWVENFGISRMIFPRNVSFDEIRSVSQTFPSLEFEIFVKNDWCYDTDGICSSLHLEGLKEGIPYVCNRESKYEGVDVGYAAYFHSMREAESDCKACSVKLFEDCPNVVSLKIVGREKGAAILRKDIAFLRAVVDYSRLADSVAETVEFGMATHARTLGAPCAGKRCEVYHNALR